MSVDEGRRAFLIGALGTAAAALHGQQAQGTDTRLILLGTGGGPRPRARTSAPAQVILTGGAAFVVDCGDGVARQLAAAGVPLPSLRHIFITHQHSDHNADYGNLIWLAWAAGLKTRVDAWGPPPLSSMTRLFFKMNAFDIHTRIADEGRAPLAPLVHVHELQKDGVVFRDADVTITAALVDHPPVVPSFAYRFDTRDRSIVISGDTKRSANLLRLARGVDVLVHEAMYLPAVDRLAASVPNASTLRAHLLNSHTAVDDVGRLAQEAGVKTLVLSHFVPTDDPDVTEQMWADAARAHFQGTVIVGRDLLEV